jgi:hypothetical protein
MNFIYLKLRYVAHAKLRQRHLTEASCLVSISSPPIVSIANQKLVPSTKKFADLAAGGGGCSVCFVKMQCNLLKITLHGRVVAVCVSC